MGPVAPLTGLLVAMFAAPSWAQRLGTAPDDDISFVRVFLALLLCLIIAVGAAYAMRGRNQLSQMLSLGLRPPQGRLRLVESLRVGPQVHVCLVVCDDQELLLAVTPQSARILKTMSSAAPRPPDEPGAAS